MANKTLKLRIVNKHDTAANWNDAADFIPKAGEIIVYTDNKKLKVGDGTTKLAALPFVGDIDLTNYVTETELASTISETVSTLSKSIGLVEDEITTHTSNTSNPHNVTKLQIGLGNVINAGQTATPTSGSNSYFTAGGAYTLKQSIDGKADKDHTHSYDDLTGKPTIPTVNNATITVQQNGATKGTFTLNQSGNATISLTDNNTTYTAGTGLTLSNNSFSVKTDYSTNGKNYAVQTDDDNSLYVNVPWTDNNTTYSAATSSTLGLVKSSTTGTTSGRDYKVQVNSDGTMKVNVPWTDTKYTLPSDVVHDSDLNSYATTSYVNEQIGNVKKAALQVVASKPSTGAEGTIYLVGSSAPYEMWTYENNAWIDLGSTEINLNNYVQSASALTADKVILGNGNKSVKSSSYTIATASSTSSTAIMTASATNSLITSKGYATTASLNSVQTALQNAINGKANTNHTHTISQITNLQSTLDTKADKDDVILKNSNIGGGSTSSTAPSIRGGQIDIHPENQGTVITYYTNDLAFLTQRGGTVQAKNITLNKVLTVNSTAFDGSPAYWQLNGNLNATTDTIEIIIKLPGKSTYSYSTNFGIGFGSSNWRAKDVKIEAGYSATNTGTASTPDTDIKWKTITNITDNGSAVINIASNGPGTGQGGTSSNTWSYLRYTLKNWNNINPRIAQIWTINYGSSGMHNTFVSRGGSTMYGTLTAPRVNITSTLTANQINWDGEQLTSQDLDDYTSATGDIGRYWAGGNNSVVNKPSGVDSFGMEVIRTATGVITELLFGHVTSDNNSVHMYMRRYYSTAGGWEEWKELLTSASLGNYLTYEDLGTL